MDKNNLPTELEKQLSVQYKAHVEKLKQDHIRNNLLLENERKESMREIERKKEEAMVKLGNEIDHMKAILNSDIENLEFDKKKLVNDIRIPVL